MSGWHHRHILDLAAFSREDYAAVLELAERFRSLPVTGARKLPALQGRLVATLAMRTAQQHIVIGAASWESGVYSVQISTEGARASWSFVK